MASTAFIQASRSAPRRVVSRSAKVRTFGEDGERRAGGQQLVEVVALVVG